MRSPLREADVPAGPSLLPRALRTSVAGLAALTLAVATLYLVKSALGINILPGHSPLHGLLYHLIR